MTATSWAGRMNEGMVAADVATMAPSPAEPLERLMVKPLREILPITNSMATAIHEAGHAVGCRALGVRVKDINLFRTKGRQGMIRWARADADWEAEFQLTLAGPLAEAMFQLEGSLGDASRLHRLLREADEDFEEWSPRIVGLAEETADLILRHRIAIEDLAHLLLARGRLSQDQVDRAMSAP